MRNAAVVAVLLLCACGGGQDVSPSADSARVDRELAKARAAAAQSPDGQVTICHIPPGNPANAHEISVGEPAVRAHVERHGDTVGGCCAPLHAACGEAQACCEGLECTEGECLVPG